MSAETFLFAIHNDSATYPILNALLGVNKALNISISEE